MRAVCRLLLHLYPRGHRDVFAQEMLNVIMWSAEDARSRGPLAYAGFAARESLALMAGAFRERLGDSPKISALPIGGGIALAFAFHTAVYLAIGKASDAAITSLQRADFVQDQSIEGLTVAIFAVAALVCLLPLFFLLSIQLRFGRR